LAHVAYLTNANVCVSTDSRPAANTKRKRKPDQTLNSHLLTYTTDLIEFNKHKQVIHTRFHTRKYFGLLAPVEY
jgi:hypothetical protein